MQQVNAETLEFIVGVQFIVIGLQHHVWTFLIKASDYSILNFSIMGSIQLKILKLATSVKMIGSECKYLV